MKDVFSDISFSFIYDNPFADDGTKTKINILKKLIGQNLAIDVSSVDKTINYYELKNDLEQLYGDDSLRKNITEIPMIDDIKIVAAKFPQLERLNAWANQFPFISNEVVLPQNSNENDNEYEEEEEKTAETTSTAVVGANLIAQTAETHDDTNWESVIPIQPYKFDYSKTNGLTNYDITSEKALSYEEIRKLTVNIARSKLKVAVEKSEQVLQLEQQKRKELMNNIQKYRNIKAIGILVEDNIQDMNLAQLEHTATYCEKLYQSQKFKEVIKRGTKFGGLILNTIFPDGIKISKNKKIKMKGTTNTILDNVFDTQSTVGVAFQNIVQKHNWNITDEAVIMLSLGEMFISSIKVENIEPPVDDKTKSTPKQEVKELPTPAITNESKENTQNVDQNQSSEYYEEEDEEEEYYEEEN